MASRRYGRVFTASTQVLTKTMTAGATIKMGTLVYQGGTEGTVVPATGTGQNVIGIAMKDDVKANDNTTATVTGSGAEFYSSGDNFGVEPLVKGQDYWVWAGETGNIAINAYLYPTTDGKVTTATVTGTGDTTREILEIIGIALEAGTGVTDAGWFRMRAI